MAQPSKQIVPPSEPPVPDGDWEEVSRGVWHYSEENEDDAIYLEKWHASGPDAHAWMVQNIYKPRVENLKQQQADLSQQLHIDLSETDSTKLELLQLEIEVLQEKLDKATEQSQASIEACV